MYFRKMRGRGNMRGSGSDRGGGGGDRHYRSNNNNNFGNSRPPFNSRNERYTAGGSSAAATSNSNRYTSDYHSGPSTSSALHYESRSREKLRSSSIGRHDSSSKRHYRASSRDHSRDRTEERKRSRHEDYHRTSSGGRGNRTPPPPPPPILSSGNYRSGSSYRSGGAAPVSRREHRNETTHIRERSPPPVKRTIPRSNLQPTRSRATNLPTNRGFANKTSFRGGAAGRMRRADPLEIRRLRRLKAIKMSRLSYLRRSGIRRRSKSPRRVKRADAGDDKIGKRKEHLKSDTDDNEEINNENDNGNIDNKKKRSMVGKKRTVAEIKRQKAHEKSTKAGNDDDHESSDINSSRKPVESRRADESSAHYNHQENEETNEKETSSNEKYDDDGDKKDAKKKKDEKVANSGKAKDEKSSDDSPSKKKDGEKRSCPRGAVRRIEESRNNKFIKLTCVHCHQRCVTFKEYSYHLTSRSHRNTLQQIAYRQKTQLLRLRASQRAAQREIEETSKEVFEPKFCHLCRLLYRQPKAKHQLSEHHKTIKKLLMPYCATCHLAFKSPMLYETHRCSIDHIRNKARHNDSDSGRSEDSDIGELDLNKFTTVDSIGEIDEEMDLESLLVDSEIAEELENEKQNNENGSNKSNTPLGAQFISTVESIYCELCKEYYPFEDIDVFTKQHCRNRSHLKAYLRHKEETRKAENDTEKSNGDANDENIDENTRHDDDNSDRDDDDSRSEYKTNDKNGGDEDEEYEDQEYENAEESEDVDHKERKPESDKRGKLKNYDEVRGLNEIVEDDQSSDEIDSKNIMLNDDNSDDNSWGDVEKDIGDVLDVGNAEC